MNEKILNCIEKFSIFMVVATSSYIIYAIYLLEFQKESETNSAVNCSTDNINILKTEIEDRIVSPNMTNSIDSVSRYVVTDNIYTTVDKDYIEHLLTLDDVNTIPYKTEVFDCDEFGLILLANIMQLSRKCEYLYRIAFGMLIGTETTTKETHLLNFFIDKKTIFWCVEPQTDEIFLCDNGKYSFEFLFI